MKFAASRDGGKQRCVAVEADNVISGANDCAVRRVLRRFEITRKYMFTHGILKSSQTSQWTVRIIVRQDFEIPKLLFQLHRELIVPTKKKSFRRLYRLYCNIDRIVLIFQVSRHEACLLLRNDALPISTYFTETCGIDIGFRVILLCVATL